MFIDNETKKRVNIYAPYKGFSKLDTAEIRDAAGVVEIPDPQPPANYVEDEWYRTEQDDAPYVVFTPKAPEQIERQNDTKARDAAQRFLNETDYLFSKDRHDRLLQEEPEREAQLRIDREAARQTIRTYKGKYPEGV